MCTPYIGLFVQHRPKEHSKRLHGKHFEWRSIVSVVYTCVHKRSIPSGNVVVTMALLCCFSWMWRNARMPYGTELNHLWHWIKSGMASVRVHCYMQVQHCGIKGVFVAYRAHNEMLSSIFHVTCWWGSGVWVNWAMPALSLTHILKISSGGGRYPPPTLSLSLTTDDQPPHTPPPTIF